jgi:hypothetical protein
LIEIIIDYWFLGSRRRPCGEPVVHLIVHSEEMGRQPSPSPKLSESVPQ